jgi:hypothetical protein
MFVISGSGALEQDARYQDDDAPRHRWFLRIVKTRDGLD